MPDYVYLLENRLSHDQQSALNQVRDAAREASMTVFLTGGAVRDLTSGSPVRDLDFSVQGEALKLRKTLEKQGAVPLGEHTPSQTLFLRFPGGARVEISAIRREEHPKPGKTIYQPGTIQDDLRRRDFTANAMALSLNEGSYGLLMDPLNGVADIESRLLRLVSNYGFIEEPVRMIRATRLLARLGWEMDEKTQGRFENAKNDGLVSSLSAYHRGYELQEIAHEEDGLKILKVLESAGWMTSLFPSWTSAGADAAGLEQLRDIQSQLQMQGVNPDTSAAQIELLTAKLPEKEVAALKRLFVRQGFVTEWERLESDAKEFGKVLAGKQASSPSEIWKLFTTSNAEAILWLGLTSKSAAIQAKYNNFFAVWPEARQRIPYALLQEMRITPELPGYQDLLKQIFLQLIDGGLETEEKMRAFLEPFSPPAPPPPVSIRRTRGKKSSARARADIEDEDDDERPGRGAAGDSDDEKDDLDEEDSGQEISLRIPAILEGDGFEVIAPQEVVATAEPSQPFESEEEKPGAQDEPVPDPTALNGQGAASKAPLKAGKAAKSGPPEQSAVVENGVEAKPQKVTTPRRAPVPPATPPAKKASSAVSNTKPEAIKAIGSKAGPTSSSKSVGRGAKAAGTANAIRHAPVKKLAKAPAKPSPAQAKKAVVGKKSASEKAQPAGKSKPAKGKKPNPAKKKH